jgi:hypothetical protein
MPIHRTSKPRPVGMQRMHPHRRPGPVYLAAPSYLPILSREPREHFARHERWRLVYRGVRSGRRATRLSPHHARRQPASKRLRPFRNHADPRRSIRRLAPEGLPSRRRRARRSANTEHRRSHPRRVHRPLDAMTADTTVARARRRRCWQARGSSTSERHRCGCDPRLGPGQKQPAVSSVTRAGSDISRCSSNPSRRGRRAQAREAHLGEGDATDLPGSRTHGRGEGHRHEECLGPPHREDAGEVQHSRAGGDVFGNAKIISLAGVRGANEAKSVCRRR